MKKLVKYGVLSLFFLLSGWMASAQETDAEVPGDNFSLEGVLELFKKSASPEEFERQLNTSDARVNNLDLNGDGKVDYIKVIDRNEGNVHAFILQAIIAEKEYQDVAVIELEKLANGKAVLQITGDADVYGIETIIEPTEEVRVNAGATVQRRVVNVWTWPSVQYVYGPYYTGWVSPWRWSMRPVWWSAWGPVAYYEYRPWWQPYRPYYTVCYSHRIAYAQRIYRPYRTTSVIVYNKHHKKIARYRSSRNDNRQSRDRYDNAVGRNDVRDRSNENRKPLTSRDDYSSRERSSVINRTPPASHRNYTLPQKDEQQSIRQRENSQLQGRSTYERRPATKTQIPQMQQRNSSVQQRSIEKLQRSDNDTRQISRQPVSRPKPEIKSSPRSSSPVIHRSGAVKKKGSN